MTSGEHTTTNTGDNTITVVVIEDDPSTSELMRLILQREGFTVHTAPNGRQGLMRIEQNQPDVVLLDLMMSDMDGWEVFQNMKTNEAMRHIPVIIITAKAQSIDKVLGLHIAKVDDYITKPFAPSELTQAIRKVLHDKHANNLHHGANSTPTG
jgi:two-component system, OmpR family, response regulator VicR